jgi:DNA-binding MarR family transcriptional regulator
MAMSFSLPPVADVWVENPCNDVKEGAKYVNMADVNSRALWTSRDELTELVELLFFAYRDFTGDPDAILKAIGFGRAHHRVLHFVGRSPGMRVAELLDILKITKQSLGRVLRELIEKGYIVQAEGSLDRRQRLLYLTPRGKALHGELMAPQLHRIESALSRSGWTGEVLREILMAMIDPEGREQWRSLRSHAAPSTGEIR